MNTGTKFSKCLTSKVLLKNLMLELLSEIYKENLQCFLKEQLKIKKKKKNREEKGKQKCRWRLFCSQELFHVFQSDDTAYSKSFLYLKNFYTLPNQNFDYLKQDLGDQPIYIKEFNQTAIIIMLQWLKVAMMQVNYNHTKGLIFCVACVRHKKYKRRICINHQRNRIKAK